MSRNSSGTATQPANTAAVPLQTASSTAFNTLVSDIYVLLTDSLDRTGKGAMQAQFKATDGTVSAPGIAFSGQTNTGLYRVDDNSAALTQQGVKSFEFNATQNKAPDGSAGASDLVTNGDFVSFSGWSGANWSQSGTTALHAAGSTTSLIQTVSLVAGTKYLLTYTISAMTVGDLQPQFQGGSTVSATDRTANGTYQDIITAVAGNTTLAFTPSSDFDGAIDDVSMYEAAIPSITFQGDNTSGLRSRDSGIGIVVGNIDVAKVTSDGIVLDADKTLTLDGTALGVGTQTINLLAAGMVARVSSGTPTASTAESGITNPKTLAGYKFTAGANQGLQIAFPMPKSWDAGTLSLSCWYYVPNSTVGNIIWRARAVALGNGDDFDATAWGTFVQIIDATTATNLVTNGNFTSFTGWSGTNWSQVANAAKHATGSTDPLIQTISLTAGVTYTVIYDITGRTAGTVQPQFTGGSTVSGTSRSASATALQDSMVAVSGNNTLAFTPSSTFDGSIDNVFVYAAGTAMFKADPIVITSGGTPAGNAMLMVEIERRGANASDTLTQDAVLIATQMTYGSTALTDD